MTLTVKLFAFVIDHSYIDFAARAMPLTWRGAGSHRRKTREEAALPIDRPTESQPTAASATNPALPTRAATAKEGKRDSEIKAVRIHL